MSTTRRSGIALLIASCALALTATALGVVKPKPWQWTTAQASAAMMRQSMSFYRVPGSDIGGNLASVRCRGTGTAVQHRFVAFTCSGLAEGNAHIRIAAKTRRGGGLCWAVAPAPIPSGCLARGLRVAGSVNDAGGAMFDIVGGANQFFHCWPNGAGFFSCSWSDTNGIHRGVVVFSPKPKARVVS